MPPAAPPAFTGPGDRGAEDGGRSKDGCGRRGPQAASPAALRGNLARFASAEHFPHA